MGTAEGTFGMGAGAVAVIRWADEFMHRARTVAYTVLVVCALMFAWQALANRSPPFKVLSVEPATARPGDYVRIYASVWRDPYRQCSADISRSLYDRDGLRFDLGASYFSWAAIAAMENSSPGRLAISVQVPAAMLPGRANIQTSLSYACNPAQKIFPIDVTTDMPFHVLPPP